MPFDREGENERRVRLFVASVKDVRTPHCAYVGPDDPQVKRYARDLAGEAPRLGSRWWWSR